MMRAATSLPGVIVFGLCGVAVFVGLYGYVFFQSEAVDWTGQESVLITLADTGFEPAEVYVSRGTRVTFVSGAGKQFWPASDLHPFHSIYSAFDPKRPLDSGEDWSFVFDKDGHWNYHDHMNPIFTGVIVVVPPGHKADKKFDVLAQCDQENLDGRRSCWKYRVAVALEDGGLQAALDQIQAVYEEHVGFPDDCHLYVHDLGLLTYQKYGTLLPMREDMTICGQGFFHGYMEGVLAANSGDVAKAAELCARVGRRFAHSNPFLGPQCYHGIGHGQMEYILTVRVDLIHDIPRIVQMGLDDCAALPDENTRFRCGSGVYAVMKDWVNLQDLTGVHAAYFSLRDVYALCRTQTEEWAQRACGWELSKQALIMAKRDPDVAFPAIVRSGTAWAPELLPIMVRSAAFLIGERGVEIDDIELATSCRTVRDPNLRASCVEGIENGLLFSAHPGNEVERSIRFCSLETLSKLEREACGAMLVTYMTGAYGNPGKEVACQALFEEGIDVRECKSV